MFVDYFQLAASIQSFCRITLYRSEKKEKFTLIQFQNHKTAPNKNHSWTEIVNENKKSKEKIGQQRNLANFLQFFFHFLYFEWWLRRKEIWEWVKKIEKKKPKMNEAIYHSRENEYYKSKWAKPRKPFSSFHFTAFGLFFFSAIVVLWIVPATGSNYAADNNHRYGLNFRSVFFFLFSNRLIKCDFQKSTRRKAIG